MHYFYAARPARESRNQAGAPWDPGARPRLARRCSLFVPQRRGPADMKGSGAMKPSSMFYVHEADVVQIHHFLEECSLCAKSLSGDIFMYRSPRHATPRHGR